MVGGPFIRSTSLIGFLGTISDYDGDAELIMRNANLELDLFANFDVYISYEKLASAMENASKTLNAPLLGCDWAKSCAPYFQNFGPAMYISHFEDTLENWVKAYSNHLEYYSNAFSLELIKDYTRKEATLRVNFESNDSKQRQIQEYILCSINLMMTAIAQTTEPLARVTKFPYPQPLGFEQNRDKYPGNVEFKSDHFELIFNLDVIEAEIRQNILSAQQTMEYYIKSRLEHSPFKRNPSMSNIVSMALLSIFGTKKCNLEAIASSLKVGPKKLQRLLAAEDAHFSDIREEARETTAHNLLSESNLSVKTIAGLLDYASTPPFTLAHKRWTGLSPKQYRDKFIN
ncbi:MAG: hypothetical protein COC17_00010 [Hyphomicrobiales bacterium]|nr:AraC family transcriptional regulator ligand-binding domain-containing protein [Hyphomicrobiales bacterium]PCH51523.1 MAG: hypothetical protein COC17_00010 [Hyphomicrobiales bacterium]